MIYLSAHYFDGQRSRAQQVDVEVGAEQLLLRLKDGTIKSVASHQCTIEAPLGKLERSVRLTDGGQLTTTDFAAIARWEKQLDHPRGQGIIHRIEQRWILALTSVVVLALVGSFAIFEGIPFLAAIVAPRVPPAILDPVSQKTMAALDAHWFDETTLPPRDQMRVEALFEKTREQYDPDLNVHLNLRDGVEIGANAFALPDGTIVVTDQLVHLAQSDPELIGILVHEMAHVQGHHTLRSLLQNSGVYLLISTTVGDVTAISGLAATLPTFLVEQGYSRDFEREADDQAAAYLRQQGWGVLPYTVMLNRLDQQEERSQLSSYIATHPQTRERIERLQPGR